MSQRRSQVSVMQFGSCFSRLAQIVSANYNASVVIVYVNICDRYVDMYVGRNTMNNVSVFFCCLLLVGSACKERQRETESMNGKWSGNSFLLGSSSLALTMAVS